VLGGGECCTSCPGLCTLQLKK